MAAIRVAITGIGLATALGMDRESTWSALCRGERAVRTLTEDDFLPELRPTLPPAAPWLAGAPLAMPRRQDTSRLSQFAHWLAEEAVAHRGGIDDIPPARRGVVLGASKTDLSIVPALESSLWTGHASAAIANSWDCQGAALTPVAACATGLISLIHGAALIQQGVCDLVLAGSVDASLHPAVLASYHRLGVLAHAGDDPACACRPFDAHRRGFAIGEGGAILILEAWDHAVRHGQPFAEWISGKQASDPTGLTQLDESGRPLSELFRRLYQGLNVDPQGIDCISLHGTATRSNDIAESQAVEKLLAAKSTVTPCFGIKGAIGHLLGAAGSVEAAVSVLAIRDQLIPPTPNLTIPDPRCRLCYSGGKASNGSINQVLKVSLGFGGHLAAAVLQRPT